MYECSEITRFQVGMSCAMSAIGITLHKFLYYFGTADRLQGKSRLFSSKTVHQLAP